MKQLHFNNLDEFYATCLKDINNWSMYSRQTSGTQDEYKKKLIEKTQFFYILNDMTKVISNNSNFRQYAWWAISEFLTELFADPVPLMAKYRQDIIDMSYKKTLLDNIRYMYGVRWQNYNQLDNLINILEKRLDSKRAVLQIYAGYDTDPNIADVPCTINHMFTIRNNKIHCTASFRSHDLFAGHKYDILLASFLSQIIAMELNARLDLDIQPGQLGVYENNLHIYPLKNNIKEFKHDDAPQKIFNIMYDYQQSKDVFKDLRRVKKVEEMAYYGAFEQAANKIKQIQNVAFKDWAKIYYNRNVKCLDVDLKYLKYASDIFKW